MTLMVVYCKRPLVSTDGTLVKTLNVSVFRKLNLFPGRFVTDPVLHVCTSISRCVYMFLIAGFSVSAVLH